MAIQLQANCLNPFEVREVLQELDEESGVYNGRLNPFEVREVLQVKSYTGRCVLIVSIPLKSGRCCKKSWRSVNGLHSVSIPLKSGRCCKHSGF